MALLAWWSYPEYSTIPPDTNGQEPTSEHAADLPDGRVHSIIVHIRNLLTVMRHRSVIPKAHAKLAVATQQLDTALRLYFGRREYFSAITLAGAAEEILGVYLKKHRQPNAFDDDLDSTLRVYRWLHKEEGSPDRIHNAINRVKNSAKHMRGKSDVEIVCDPREEARTILDRAVSNYYRLMSFEELQETERIRRFNAHLIGKAA